MGHKKACLECRVIFNRPFESGSVLEYPCPECRNPMILLPYSFRPPKKSENKKWQTIKFLIDNGFRFQHIYEKNGNNGNVIFYPDYGEYPNNISDVKEFIEKYKIQAIK